ncbi:carboxymuconolactone decarboxylase family protein [Lysobacter pythonis]|uniref:Carboxymuconolactone decarboxylase family protein n=1 Tax=Solilutibacter pythonis TaxID=2483112 RepID=A0A3M2HLD6_9GAMM|nr:carboxymuconolactone decarboxylase family protein [Lysobacter pythonis]RMH87742.1 carboxymuconolactone decarboxylase family protein [Lysobacter pythonis]
MSRIEPVFSPAAVVAPGFAAMQRNLGMAPNLYATLAHPPAPFDGFLASTSALGKGRLTARQRKLPALAIGQANNCQYCLSAHTLLAGKADYTLEAIQATRQGNASDPLDHALLQLAVALVDQRGVISDEQLANTHGAGLDDELVLEVLGQVAINTLTNYGNHLAATEIDFPAIPLIH